MEKINVMHAFAARLRQAMIKAGYHSNRSTSGVDVHKLASMTGYSTQICRKYLRGEAIPEPGKLIEISSKLNVSPGWLLFGDAMEDYSLQTITISKNLLHYIFSQAHVLYNKGLEKDDIADFLLDVTHDISKIHTDEEQLKKIIDLALSSIKHFK